MAEPKNVCVFAEVDQGHVAEVSLELLNKARELASKLDGKVGAYLLGHNVEELAQTLFEHGADMVYLADDPALAKYTTLPFWDVIVKQIQETEPAVVLFGATTTGRDLAPRVASKLKVGLTADCTDLQIGPYQDVASGTEYPSLLYQIRPAFGGNIIATIVNPGTRPQMATVREGVMRMGQAEAGRTGEIVRFDAQVDPTLQIIKILEEHRTERKVDLKKAHVIVAGGAGVGSPEGFKLLQKLADVLGGEVGASRAAVDNGWIDKAHQVGQTGTTVRPKLYIACGISGAVQHRAGMQESSKIVAINNDPHAPILEFAHYGIVGDLYQVVPALIDIYKDHAK